MPTTFKPTKLIHIMARTPEEDLTLCTECGGLQAMAQTSIMMDCDNCDGTGYENLWTDYPATASYRPGAVSRWNYVDGARVEMGECSIKLDYRYRELIDNASHLLMDGIEWKFSLLSEPGQAMANQRIVLALTRK